MESPTLIVAAHPDDEVLGCGATLAALGPGMATVLFLSARPGLVEQAAAAAEVLGFTFELTNQPLPDNAFDTVPLLSIVQRVERVVARLKPATILTHSMADLNVDHRLTHQAVLTATRPGSNAHMVKTVLAFEVPSSTEWNFTGPGFRPNWFVPLETEHFAAKWSAMRCYETEKQSSPHPRSRSYLAALVNLRGAQCGHRFAEAFEVVRHVMTNEPPREVTMKFNGTHDTCVVPCTPECPCNTEGDNDGRKEAA